QIQISLTIAGLDIFQSMPLLRHREQRLRQKLNLIRMHAQLSRACAEQISFHPDNVAEIHDLVKAKIAFADRVLLDIDLQPLAFQQQKQLLSGEHAIIQLPVLNRSISTTIAAYHEEKRLPGTIENVIRFLDSEVWEFAEIVVVADGSKDNPAALAESFANH